MEKINVAELLKDCPKGMELDCTMYDSVQFDFVQDGNAFPIKINTPEGRISLSKYGCYSLNSHCKCIIFPKDKTTWEGFIPPCKFKDGDVVINHNNIGTWIGIYHRHNSSNESFSSYCYIRRDKTFCANYGTGHGYYQTRLATEDEKQELFNVIKENGYHWNAETKTIEKLIEPKFKVGDKVRHKNNPNVCFTITSIEEDSYVCGAKTAFWFDDQDDYELVPNKFDIDTLKAFDSRVLVRDYSYGVWRVSLWGCLINNEYGFKYDTVRGCYKQCIPYECNEHLLGTTDDCEEFYKTWK